MSQLLPNRNTPACGLPVRAWLAALVVCGAASAEDAVIVAGGAGGQNRVRRTGEILDYTGQTLLLRTAGGAEISIPADRVLEVQTAWTAPHQRGDAAFAEGNFSEALNQYRDAARQETRAWVRRRLLAQVVWCYRNLAQPESALGAFLALTAEDPATPHFDAIPLAWTSAQPGPAFEGRLRTWLAGENATAALLAASWLLTTRDRTAATEKLRSLATHDDRRLAALATAQLWRTQQATAKADDVARWRSFLESIPEPLRPGPYYVVGQALARLGESRQATFLLLRVPVLFPQHRDLAAESLLAAARELDRLDRGVEAQELYRELATGHADSPLADLARQRLEARKP